MSIRIRLFLMLVGGVCLPAILMLFFKPLFLGIGSENETEKELVARQAIYFTSPAKQAKISEVVQELMAALKDNPALILDSQYNQALDEKLQIQEAGLIVTDSTTHEIYFRTPSIVLPEEKNEAFDPDVAVAVAVVNDFSPLFVHRFIHVNLPDKRQVDAVIASNYVRGSPAKTFVVRHFISIFLAYNFMFILLAVLVARSIDTPLNRLKKATVSAGAGDYSYRIGVYTRDSIGDVSRAFDAMLDKLQEADQLKRLYVENRQELVASISHDLRTPLTAVKMHVAALAEGVADTAFKRERSLAVITSRIETIERLIEELFLYSKLEMQQEYFSLQPVGLHRFLEDVIEEWQNGWGSDVLMTSFQYSPAGEFTVRIDVDKMKRVVINILENALHYAGAMPLRITFILEATDSEVTLCIRDNGVGVEASELPRLFDRFYRVEKSRLSSVPGSGLGLCIARQIVEGHGGSIQADSGPDQGLGIQISLPKEREGSPDETDTYH